MESQLKQAYGEPSAWDSSTLQKMGSLLGSMEPDTLRSISKENVSLFCLLTLLIQLWLYTCNSWYKSVYNVHCSRWENATWYSCKVVSMFAMKNCGIKKKLFYNVAWSFSGNLRTNMFLTRFVVKVFWVSFKYGQASFFAFLLAFIYVSLLHNRPCHRAIPNWTLQF